MLIFFFSSNLDKLCHDGFLAEHLWSVCSTVSGTVLLWLRLQGLKAAHRIMNYHMLCPVRSPESG